MAVFCCLFVVRAESVMLGITYVHAKFLDRTGLSYASNDERLLWFIISYLDDLY